MNKATLKLLLSTSFLVALTTSCATKERILDFTYASTKLDKIEAEGESLGEVESEAVCQGKDDWGLMETAVDEALSMADGDAAYLKDVTVYKQGACVVVSGTAYTKGEKSSAAKPAVEPEAPAGPKDGAAGGKCYGNGTCDTGLNCEDGACAAAPAPEVDAASSDED